MFKVEAVELQKSKRPLASRRKARERIDNSAEALDRPDRRGRLVIEIRRRHYNALRAHASLSYEPPAPEVFVRAVAAWPSAHTQTAPTATLPLAPRSPLY